MKRNEQIILLGLAVVGLIAGFWLLVLSPKRNEASKLQDEVGQLEASLAQTQQEIATAKSARKSFGIDYRRLVVLGKAVPADNDQTSLLVQLQGLADQADVNFKTFDLAAGSTASTPPPPTTTDSSSSDTSTETAPTDSSSTTSTVSAVPSEAAVSALPIGASVGPAGLPIMPYTLGFEGGFFEIADFMKSLDDMVQLRNGTVDVKGRLLTVDGFTFTASPTSTSSTPVLTAELNVTSFVTPADQGLTGGATPSGPAPSSATPVSSTTTGTTADTGSIPTSSATAPTP